MRLRRVGRVVLLSGLGLALAAYAAVWSVPPWHAVVTETIMTTRHSSLDRLFMTPRAFRALRQQWLDTPDIVTVTPLQGGPAGPSQPGGEQPGGGVPPLAPGTALQRISGTGYTGWVLTIDHPGWVHVGMAPQLGVVGEQTPSIGERYSAIAAINAGGFFDAHGKGTGGIPVGAAISYGHVLSFPDVTGDYLIGFDRRNRLVAGKLTVSAARAMGIRDAVAFKPLLVVNGKPQITSGDGGWGIGPRTAIGQRPDGAVVFVVVNGRQVGSLGATLRQVQDVLLAQGVATGANLDGGSSTTLWYRGRVLNHPCCSVNGMRYIPDAFVVTPGNDRGLPVAVQSAS